jgi:hypothetical protein
MLGVLDSLLSNGALFDLGNAVVDAVSSACHSLSHFFDLPVDTSTLESAIRFVKKSGLENEIAVPMVTSVGLKIGGARFMDRQGSRVPSSASSTSGFQEKDISGPDSYLRENSSKIGFATVVPRAMFVFLVMDLLSLVLARQSSLNPCVSKLGIIRWVVGGALLGFPSTWLVDSVRREYSFRAAFIAELILILVSFLWLCYGGATVFNVVSTCVDSIAPLWWLSYASSVLSLSIAGTVIFCMIVTTVLSLIYGSTQGK